jgi:site-specific DNA recombinase
MSGRTCRPEPPRSERRYYSCAGKDCILSGRASACPSRNVKAEALEAAVWDHVVGLLSDPGRLADQFMRCLAAGQDDAVAQAADEQLALRRRRLDRQEGRLLDAYQAEVIGLEELAARRQQIVLQRQALERQQTEQDQLRQRRHKTQEVLGSLATFTERIRDRLQTASFADQRAILELVIERITIHDSSLEIRHVIPLRSPSPNQIGVTDAGVRLRSDGVNRAAQALGDHTGPASRGAQEHDLRPSDSEGAGGTQAGFKLGALRRAQLTDEQGWVHPLHLLPAPASHKTSVGNALGACHHPFPIWMLCRTTA